MELIRHELLRDFLPILGRDFSKLTHFHLAFLRQDDSLSRTISFRGYSKDDVPEQCWPGLDMSLKGPRQNRILTRITYQGRDAGSVMMELVKYAN